MSILPSQARSHSPTDAAPTITSTQSKNFGGKSLQSFVGERFANDTLHLATSF
jgi:hypothetical protein